MGMWPRGGTTDQLSCGRFGEKVGKRNDPVSSSDDAKMSKARISQQTCWDHWTEHCNEMSKGWRVGIYLAPAILLLCLFLTMSFCQHVKSFYQMIPTALANIFQGFRKISMILFTCCGASRSRCDAFLPFCVFDAFFKTEVEGPVLIFINPSHFLREEGQTIIWRWRVHVEVEGPRFQVSAGSSQYELKISYYWWSTHLAI